MSDNVIYTLSKKFALRIVKLYNYLYEQKKRIRYVQTTLQMWDQVSVQISQKVFMRRVRQTISVN